MWFILIATVAYSVAIVLLTVASRHLNTNLASGIINLISAVIPLAVAIPLVTKRSLVNSKFGLSIALLGGVCVAIFAMALSKSYSVNKVGIVSPVVFGGAILLSAILSLIFLKEKITLLQVVGMFILALGLGVIIYARASGR